MEAETFLNNTPIKQGIRIKVQYETYIDPKCGCVKIRPKTNKS